MQRNVTRSMRKSSMCVREGMMMLMAVNDETE